jgi:predicted GNAT superfamily acetyltransferase
MTPYTIRDLSSLADCRAVVGVQEAVWGRDGEIVPASVLLVSAKRGGILVGAEVTEGAEDAERRDGGTERRDGGTDRRKLLGFVWSMPGVKDGVRTHWSHMLGVLPEARGSALGLGLKLAQRERALAQRVELVEWTFDPLQAANAHFNLHVLGAVGVTYGVDVYGNLGGPLHRGTPTDRLIVEWRLSEPHVIRRLEARASEGGRPVLTARSAEVLDAPQVVRTRADEAWTRFDGLNDTGSARRVLVAIPPRFGEMQSLEIEMALEWRFGVREALSSRLAAGYQAVDFYRAPGGGGSYLLST